MSAVRRLRTRLFLSYVVVVVVGLAAMYLAALAAMPRIVDAHVGTMMGVSPMMRSMMGGPAAMDAALADAFRDALRQSLLVSGMAALVAAVAVSVFVAQGFARPMQRLSEAARRIASGHYGERVPLPGTDEIDAFATSFNEMAGALGRDEARRVQLIGDVAHELRTPVATIEGYLEGMLDGVVQPSGKTIALLLDETARLRRLVADLSELSKAEARQLPLSLKAEDPREIVETTLARLRPDFAAKGLSLQVSLPERLPLVQADRDRTVQALTNLVTNALRYTPAPGRVTVAVQPSGTTVCFAVEDTGQGLAAEDLSQVFERFFRADKSRSRASGGSGVGLTITRALVEAMGGRVSAASPGLDRGATFGFSLPVAPAPARLSKP